MLSMENINSFFLKKKIPLKSIYLAVLCDLAHLKEDKVYVKNTSKQLIRTHMKSRIRIRKKNHSGSTTLLMSLWPGERYSDDVAVWSLGEQGVHRQTMVNLLVITLQMCFKSFVCKLASTRCPTVLPTSTAISNVHCTLVCFLIPYDLPQRIVFLTVLSFAIFY